MATKKTETVTHLSWKSLDIGWHSLIIATVGWGVGYKKINTVNLALVNSLQCLTLLVGRQEGHPACKKLDVVLLMVCDRSFASLIAPIVTTAFIILSFNNIQNGYVLVSANPGLPGKWPLKRTEREREICICPGNVLQLAISCYRLLGWGAQRNKHSQTAWR